MTLAPWRSRITGHAEVAPADLVPNPRNWRIHRADQQRALAGALSEVGWVTEVIVNQTTGRVVDGHLRIELALARDEPTVPVTYVELTEEEEGLVLATLDPIGAMADAEAQALESLLASLDPADADLRAFIDELTRQQETETIRAGLLDPDDVPDVPDEPWVKPGELYGLGDHRLLCGDATDGDVVRRLFGSDTQADLIWTDPPYGVAYQTKLSTEEAVARHRRTDGLEVANDQAAMASSDSRPARHKRASIGPLATAATISRITRKISTMRACVIERGISSGSVPRGSEKSTLSRHVVALPTGCDQQSWPMVGTTCTALRADGHPCKATPLRDEAFCFFHSPETAEEAADARRLGGLHRRKKKSVAAIYGFNGLRTIGDNLTLLETLVIETMTLENSIARNRAAAGMVGTALKFIELGDLAERVAALEASTRRPAVVDDPFED